MYALQLVDATEPGPNALTQEASNNYQHEVASMPLNVRETLLGTGCLTEVDVLLAREFVAAWSRLHRGYAQSGTVTVEQYAQACADIKLTVPTMNHLEAIPEHFLHWWRKLVPPPGMGKFHSAVMDIYREWVTLKSGDPNDLSLTAQMALHEATQSLDRNHFEILLREKCAG